MSKRTVEKIFGAKEALEGAGVRLMRGFGYHEAPQFDPFLLFDDFSNTDAEAYRAGFPTHPHRGIETVTYILSGEVRHKDSLGNAGSIRDGEIQWMTAGSGIIHEEMPAVHDGGIRGFQLWVNLPSKDKMMHPRYQEIKAPQIPIVKEDGVDVRVIAGMYKDTKGPVQDLMVSPTYLDVTLAPHTSFAFPTDAPDNYFVYVCEGSLVLREGQNETWVNMHDVGLLTKGDSFFCEAGKDAARFLVVGGTPLKEPIAWYGPIVMNTEEELKTALEELRAGTFIKR